MLRMLKSALALTMILALAACNVTAPVNAPADDDVIAKQEIEHADEGGGTNPPPDGQFPDYEEDEEEEEEEVSGGGRQRGNQNIR